MDIDDGLDTGGSVGQKPWRKAPAFPIEYVNITSNKGLTIRDYFAAAALTGLCACSLVKQDLIFAETAYKIADNMMEERKKHE